MKAALFMMAWVMSIGSTLPSSSPSNIRQRLWISGVLLNHNPKSLSIKASGGEAGRDIRVVQTDEDTRYIIDLDREVGGGGLKDGMLISVRQEPSSGGANAPIIVHAWSPQITGRVKRLSGTEIILEPLQKSGEAQDTKIKLGEKTVVQGPTDLGVFVPGEGIRPLSDLRIGMIVSAVIVEGKVTKIFIGFTREFGATLPAE